MNANFAAQLQQQPQQQYPQQQSQSIDPSLLAATFRNSNAGGSGSKFPYGSAGGAFNNNNNMQQHGGAGGTLNPAHLMNGVGGHQSSQHQQGQTMNPQQMFIQPQQSQPQSQPHGMNGIGGGGGINPAALTASLPAPPPVPQQQQQQQQQQQHPIIMAGMGGMTREQMQQHYNLMSHQDKQAFQAQMFAAQQQHQQQAQALAHDQQQQQQQHQHQHQHLQQQQQQQQHHPQQQQRQQRQPQQFGQQSHSHSQQQHSQQALQQLLTQQHQHQQIPYYGDRPSSSASASASHSQLMPPPSTIPPARPPTTGPGPSSRPGTSHSQTSPTQGGGGGGAQIGMLQRPPSRSTTASAGGFDGQQQQFAMPNGYPNASQPKPTTPQHGSFSTPQFQQQQPHQQPHQQQHQVQQYQHQLQQQQHQQHQHLQHQQQQQQHQHHQPQHSSPPPPGSPHRGSKRKVANGMGIEASPRPSGPVGGMGGGMMDGQVAPSGMSRQLSNSSDQQQRHPQHMQNVAQQNHQLMNGYPSQPHPQSQQQQVHPSPQSNINIGMHLQPQQPQLPTGLSPVLPHAPPISNGGMSAAMSMMNDPSRMNILPTGPMAGLGGGMNMGVAGMGLTPANDVLPRTPQRTVPSSQIPGYPGMGPPSSQQQHRQPSTPGFGSPIPGNLQQSMMQQSPIPKQALDTNMKMGNGLPLPQLGSTGGFPGLDPRAAGMPLPSRIPSVAPSQQQPQLVSNMTAAAAAAKQPPSVPGVQPLLPPLPANVHVDRQVTSVTVVPLAGSDKTIPPLSESEIKDIQGWRQTDKDYESIWRKMKERMTEEVRTVTGPSKAAWWEKDAVDPTRRRPREAFDVRYPRQKGGRDGRDRRKSRREGLKLPRKLKPEDANKPEQLVPIRLEFDVEHHKMRDSFVWNLNDPIITPEAFAQSVVEDYNLAPHYHNIITKSIQDQLSDFRIHSTNPDGDFNEADANFVRGELEEADAAWWESWRKRLRTTRGFIKAARRAEVKDRKRKLVTNGEAPGSEIPAAQPDVPMDVDDIEVDEAKMQDDVRILIKLDIIVGSMKLEDQFEWDLDNINASPEQFAEVYGADLGLTGEYKTAIAHCIREQVQMYQKSLFLAGAHSPDGPVIQDEDLRLSFLPSLSSGARAIDQVASFTPLLNYLSDGEIDRDEKEREKELNKRRKRNTRGRRGAALPDREPIRTHRTPAIGFPELDPSTLAAAVAASAPTSRRAAAAAASLTIANMVASENGTLHMPQTAPLTSQPVPSSSKEKKPKGLFKAPKYPSSILRPRAHVAAPTPSTAAESSSLTLHVDPGTPASKNAVPDSKTSKVVTAKRAKELEREAKEKEFADGQHANMIDGVWHCSNCGCPEDIAVGRRKGPLGDKSQCGTCGKYWHRHRRPMAVEYNSSAEYHLNKLKDADLAKTMARKKGGAAALRAQNASGAAAGDDTEAASSPANENAPEALPRQSHPRTVPENDRAASPGSSTSSDSESPLAQKVSKVNGSNHATSAPPAPTTPSGPAIAQPSQPASQSVPPSSGVSAPPAAVVPPEPPRWLWNATQSMRSKYPDDIFLLKRINGTEWRIKCSDCPGKLYTPGPGETLSNYEVHLKNRQHRQRVNDRKNGVTQPH